MTFEWDDNKNELNKKLHNGISFDYAVRVFLDDKRIEKYDVEHSSFEEERYDVIGMVESVLFVVYTQRGYDNIRIISARKATKEEENEYYSNYDAR